MTAVSDVQAGPDIWDRRPVLVVCIITYAALMLASFANLIDPMIRQDDFPALMSDPSGFYVKTLYEGRWINYMWHLRGVITPSWLNFAVYQLLWAIFAGAAAVNACGRSARPFYLVSMALLIAVAPQALMISFWFNTLIPGMALVALYAVLATMLSARTMRGLLLLFVPLTLTAYTTYPLLLFAICLTREGDQRNARDLVRLTGLFIFSFALGMLAIYTLNYFEHGVFGVEMASWRNPNPSHDFASAIANLQRLVETLHDTALVCAFHFAPMAVFHTVVLAVLLAYFRRFDFWASVYIFVGIFAGLGLIGVQIMKSGVWVPVRATAFVWVFYAILIVRCAQLAQDISPFWARMLRNLALILVMTHLIQIGKQYLVHTDWQRDTQDMAMQAGPGNDPIYVVGSYEGLASGDKSGILHERGLRMRLNYLTGRPTAVCSETPKDCAPQNFDVPLPKAGFTVQQFDGGTLIALPPAPEKDPEG